ncbi:MAG: YfhO family protein [Bacteroidales bacterium]|nr:YfhO family protein [Bacteroidales bacterium]
MNRKFLKINGGNLHKERFSELKIYLFLLVIIIVGYYQVALFIHPLKWDMIDQAYPYRYYIGECLRHGFFPYWLPYQQLGIPVCADPQSGVWYPITWIFGFFAGYNIYSLSAEYMLHVFLAAAGFYMLGKNLGLSKATAFIVAVSYAFSGFIIGNSQHLYYIIAAAWIPFILNSYLLLIKRNKVIYALATALFAYLLTTGGHPAFWIILFYHVVAIFIIYSATLLFKKGNTQPRSRFFMLNLVAIGTYVLLVLSYFVSVFYNQDQVGRLGGTTLEDALSGAFTPQSALSFVAPYAVTANTEFLKTDISMANAYFGIFALAFFVLYFFHKRSKLSIVILIAGVLNLLASLGSYVPVRAFLYHYVPFMDYFRFPSVFRYFAIVAFLLIAGFSMQAFFEKKDKKLIYLIIALIIVFISSAILLRTTGYLNLKNIALKLAWEYPNDTGVWQRLAFQLLIQAGWLMLFLLALRFLKVKATYLVLAFVVLDMFSVAMLNSRSTVYSENLKSAEIRNFEKQNFVKGFPIPNLPISRCSDSSGYYEHYWRNLSIFYKRPAYDGYNPFQIKNNVRLVDYQTAFFKTIKKNKLFYFADTLINGFDSITAATSGTPGMVFTECNFPGIKRHINNTGKINITGYSPNRVEAMVECSDSSLLVFFQNYNKGWVATINNTPVEIQRANLTLNALVVPPGKNEITFSYRPLPVITARYVSLGALMFVLGFIVLLIVKHKALPKELNPPK